MGNPCDNQKGRSYDTGTFSSPSRAYKQNDKTVRKAMREGLRRNQPPGAIWDADLTVDDVAMPDIRAAHANMKSKQASGLEYDLDKDNIKTIVEKAKISNNLDELAALAACTIRQRETVFDKLDQQLSLAHTDLANAKSKLYEIEELICEVKQLMVQ